MRTVGYVAIGVVAVAVAAGVSLAVRSIPDISRYRRLRRM